MDQAIPSEVILPRILITRGKRVMLDRDLAELYGVATKVLNQAVKRNIRRFPMDFMFQLTKSEQLGLVTICDRFKSLKHSSSQSYAFTEQSVAMLSRITRINISLVTAYPRYNYIHCL